VSAECIAGMRKMVERREMKGYGVCVEYLKAIHENEWYDVLNRWNLGCMFWMRLEVMKSSANA
jgi:hypothetical protein